MVFVDLAEGTTATIMPLADSIDSNLELYFINVAADDAFAFNDIVIEGYYEHELRGRLAFSAASGSDGSRNHF